jgi:hypothetical protein
VNDNLILYEGTGKVNQILSFNCTTYTGKVELDYVLEAVN